jgi:hypothetical protein
MDTLGYTPKAIAARTGSRRVPVRRAAEASLTGIGRGSRVESPGESVRRPWLLFDEKRGIPLASAVHAA